MPQTHECSPATCQGNCGRLLIYSPGFDEFLTKEISGSHNWSLLLAAFIERAYNIFFANLVAFFLLEENRTCWEILLDGINRGLLPGICGLEIYTFLTPNLWVYKATFMRLDEANNNSDFLT